MRMHGAVLFLSVLAEPVQIISLRRPRSDWGFPVRIIVRWVRYAAQQMDGDGLLVVLLFACCSSLRRARLIRMRAVV